MSATPDVLAGAAPFRDAIGLTPLGDGRYAAELGLVWAVGTKAHGGVLLVLLAKAALARLDTETGIQDRTPGLEPLAIGAEFLRAPEPGPVELHTEVLKLGRTASVAAVRLIQDGRLMLSATVTAGRLPGDAPRWVDLPELPAEPPADAFDPAGDRTTPATGLAAACELRFDTATTPFAVGKQGAPVIRGWTRPLGEDPDVLFALLAGDILPPTVFNLGGGIGWAPTVQLTALLRARPAPGWLRLESRSSTVAGPWFDEDLTVIDSAGRLICQARQIALAPLPG
ncbi:thioesterase family protein [Pseudonocardia acidicola]|uniref:Thioesterase family protein n=1 Tax=Pseudonocardia acidicola TaxID=2724939 RepID=A0ABX1S8X8_9PSEU|nr:thioesterase family protein [Pseudonocardia acidicola]NMH98021.1 thioesterase family protein [Pseudonocardia acidicola]